MEGTKKNERKGKHGVKLKTTYNFLLTVTTMDPNSWDESGWENGCLVLRKGISSEMLIEHSAGGNHKPVRSSVCIFSVEGLLMRQLTKLSFLA